MTLLLLIVGFALLAGCMRDDAGDFRRMKADPAPAARRAVYLRWSFKSGALLGGAALAVLALEGRLDALTRPPAAFLPLIRRLHPIAVRSETPSPGFVVAAAVAFIFGVALSMALGRVASRRRTKPWVDVAALTPRDGTERLQAAGLSLCAGVGEEAFFRLALPLLFCGCGLDPAAAFVASAAAFGLAHLYQGAWGVLLTGAAGGALTLLYLSSGSLAVVMLVHVAIDLNALLLRPWLAAKLARKRVGAEA